jgi:hypothetical protein
VIAVLVGEHNAGHLPEVETHAGCPPLDLSRTESGIDQDDHSL